MSPPSNEHFSVLTSVRTTLQQDGFDVEWVHYTEQYSAVVVQYTAPADTAAEIEQVLVDGIPKTTGAFQGPVIGDGDPGTYSRMIVLVANSSKPPADRTGKLRWRIDWSWLPEEADAPDEEYEEPFQRVLDTAAVVDDGGVHGIDTEFGFTDL